MIFSWFQVKLKVKYLKQSNLIDRLRLSWFTVFFCIHCYHSYKLPRDTKPQNVKTFKKSRKTSQRKGRLCLEEYDYIMFVVGPDVFT